MYLFSLLCWKITSLISSGLNKQFYEVCIIWLVHLFILRSRSYSPAPKLRLRSHGFQKDIAFAFVKFLKRNKQINIISGAGRVFFEQDFYKSTSLNTLTKVFDLKNAVCVHRNLLCVHHVHFKILAFAFAFWMRAQNALVWTWTLHACTYYVCISLKNWKELSDN